MTIAQILSLKAGYLGNGFDDSLKGISERPV